MAFIVRTHICLWVQSRRCSDISKCFALSEDARRWRSVQWVGAIWFVCHREDFTRSEEDTFCGHMEWLTGRYYLKLVKLAHHFCKVQVLVVNLRHTQILVTQFPRE